MEHMEAKSLAPCCRSTVRLSQPWCASISAARVPGRVIQQFRAGLPDAHNSRIRLARMPVQVRPTAGEGKGPFKGVSLETLSTTCVIAGGGPAGMMCGYMLARAGVDVTVLEKHGDFLRDFRGDTVHPSPLQVMEDL